MIFCVCFLIMCIVLSCTKKLWLYDGVILWCKFSDFVCMMFYACFLTVYIICPCMCKNDVYVMMWYLCVCFFNVYVMWYVWQYLQWFCYVLICLTLVLLCLTKDKLYLFNYERIKFHWFMLHICLYIRNAYCTE